MHKGRLRRILVVLPILALTAGGIAYQASNTVAPSYAGVMTVHASTTP